MPSPHEASTNLPKLADAIEYAKLSKFIHKLATGSNDLEIHYHEKNDNESVAMVVTSSVKQYVGIVFGGPENSWQKLRAAPLREMGPQQKNENLPFEISENEAVDISMNVDDDIRLTEEETAVSTPAGDMKAEATTEAPTTPASAPTPAPVPTPPKKEKLEIHPGINDALFELNLHTNVEESLNSVIKNCPGYRVVVTGFGMGAAMATIFAAYLCKQKPILDVTVVNFGSPRIGSEAFCKWIDEISNLTIWRFVYKFDAIAGIPSVAIGFRHVGHMIYLKDKDHGTKAYYYAGCMGIGDEFEGYLKPPELLTPLAELGPIQDHDIELYIKFLEEQAREDPKKFYASRFERKAGFVAKLQEIPLLEKCLNMVDKTCGTN